MTMFSILLVYNHFKKRPTVYITVLIHHGIGCPLTRFNFVKFAKAINIEEI